MVNKLWICSIALISILLLTISFHQRAEAQVGLDGLFCPAVPNTVGLMELEYLNSAPAPDFSAGMIGIVNAFNFDVTAGLDWMHSSDGSGAQISSTPTNKNGSQLVGWWSQESGRNTYIQVAHNNNGFVDLFIHIMDENCTVIRSFCDEYTGYDTHEYNLGDLFANDGSDIADGNLQGNEGIYVVTAVDNCIGSGNAIEHEFISGYVQIHDSEDYLYGYNMYARQAVCFDESIDNIVNLVQNGSFQDGELNPINNWQTIQGNSLVITADVIVPNVIIPAAQSPDSENPNSNLFMGMGVSSQDQGEQAGPYGFELDGITPIPTFPFPVLANRQLINTSSVETNFSVTQSNPLIPVTAGTLTYDMSFLAPSNNTCDNFAAVLLIDGSGSIEDSNCYSSTGNGFIQTNNGSVPCIQLIDDNTPYSSNNFNFEGGRSVFLSGESLSIPAIDQYVVQFVTGQISDNGCADASEDTGVLVDNFRFAENQPIINSCNGTLTGAPNAHLDTIKPSVLNGQYSIPPGESSGGSDVIVMNFIDDYGPPYAVDAAFSTLRVGSFGNHEDFQSCGDATVCFVRLGIDDAIINSDNFVVPTTAPPTTSPPSPTPTPMPLLSISKNGSGSGTVSSSPPGINCGGDCSQQYSVGTVVTLTPTPSSGSVFSGWSGSSDCSDGVVTMNNSLSCTATFNLEQFDLTINKMGNGSGSVASVPSGINCGGDCSQPYNFGTSVALTTIPAPGSVFAGFGGNADCMNGIVLMDEDIVCEPVFSQNEFFLIVTKDGTGGGTVTSPSGINCGSDCLEGFDPASNSVVTLTPTPDANSVFSGWSGDADCSDGNVTINSNKTCVVTFDKTEFGLTVVLDGSAPGSVSSTPGGISCGADCDEMYPKDQVVVLIPVPAAGATFGGWTGDEDCTDGIVTMDSDITCTARFNTLNRFTLNVAKLGTGMGTVFSGPPGIDCGPTCQADYDMDMVVALTAVPDPGQVFTGWLGDPDCMDGVVTMSINRNCSAVFELLLPNITLLPMVPGRAGIPNNITVTGATPNEDVTILWGFTEQESNADDICAGLEVGIFNPRTLTTTTSDALGVVTVDINIPANLAGISVVTQAVDLDTCTPSNVRDITFGDPPPPSIPVFNPLDPGDVGIDNIITISNATPGTSLKIIWGTQLGPDFTSSFCPGTTVGIQNFKNLLNTTADGAGIATEIRNVPLSVAGLTIYLQAVDTVNCVVSNVDEENF